ncbi:MAG: hypothetical protein GEV11_08580 [Streptosporangiales bacterium]|nr:hypothetical protein [Streptosporangiales bacterium]
MTAIRIGALGAATILPWALIRPARAVDGLEVTAVASRDHGRAEAFAARHALPVVHDSYADLLDDPEVDAVYIPLPNGLHAEWALRAIEAGKHVLCEKPFTANRAEAESVAAAADAVAPRGQVVMEAFQRLRSFLGLQRHRGGRDGAFRQTGCSAKVTRRRWCNPSRSRGG